MGILLPMVIYPLEYLSFLELRLMIGREPQLKTVLGLSFFLHSQGWFCGPSKVVYSSGRMWGLELEDLCQNLSTSTLVLFKQCNLFDPQFLSLQNGHKSYQGELLWQVYVICVKDLALWLAQSWSQLVPIKSSSSWCHLSNGQQTPTEHLLPVRRCTKSWRDEDKLYALILKEFTVKLRKYRSKDTNYIPMCLTLRWKYVLEVIALC